MSQMRFAVVLAVFIVTVVAAIGTASPATAAPAGPTLPATCTSGGVSADCTLQLIAFSRSGGTLAAVLRLTNEATAETTDIKVPITSLQQGGTCTILDLTLGPIDLFLLGLRVQTNEIHLTITAQRGTLLGDLLCGLFFNGLATPQLAGALNTALSDVRVA
jgi:ABC-type glycerol-3-phosphate transport system substrate-binding protein